AFAASTGGVFKSSASASGAQVLREVACVMQAGAAVLPGVTLEEAQRLVVELGDAFVDRGMRAGLEHREFASLDAVLHRVGEAGRGDEIVAAEGDLGRRLD